ncbi:hypothetical protein [Hankyongella ginsenosidimutans]|uniref:hypothetical protein n=1 Tax=Hankyongella ginsenosidimutans TaxID=1763828 RepID=UPI003CCC8E2F
MAGLIPCPLTLFVMTFALSRGVPEAGVAFAGVMMLAWPSRFQSSRPPQSCSVKA